MSGRAPLRRVGRALLRLLLATALLLLLVALGVLLVPFGERRTLPRPSAVDGREPLELHGTGALRAGAAKVQLHPPPHGPIAGYPAWRRDDGSGEPLYARALVLEQGPLQATLVSLPLMLVPGPLEEEIARRAGVTAQRCLMIAATHTHAGPGGSWDDLLLEVGGNGLYAQERAAAIAQAAAEAIDQARAQLGSAQISAGLEGWADGPAVSRSGGAIDRALGAVRVQALDGRPLATIAIYGMHATVTPRSSHALSGDWPEASARALEEEAQGAPALLFQGAGGDATYARDHLPPDPALAARELGAKVAHEAERLLATIAPLPPAAPLGCSTRLIALPSPQAGPAIPRLLRRGAGDLLDLFAPRAVVQSTLELPGLVLLGVPGEPVGELARTLRAITGRPLALVGLADGYAGYVETGERWRRGEGESARSWYGPQLAAALSLEPP